MSELAIKVEDLWKQYRLGHKKSASFRESIGQWFTKSETDYFWALKELSFEIKRGEAVGIIGKNGAGKSTLLKVLSKITYPTKGRIEINGRVSSLLEVGTGFHPELTGRQNVFLNGTILGMTKREIQSKFDEIVAFSGVEKFIDTPVKHYSSGMKVRLAFSVAAHLEPEILIIDEVLAVGDAEFQKKCLGKMEDVTGEGRTVLFVSHNLTAVERLCSQAIYLNGGQKILQDSTGKVIKEYLKIPDTSDLLSIQFAASKTKAKLSFVKLEVLTETDDELPRLGKPLRVRLFFEISDTKHSFNGSHFSISFRDSMEKTIIHHTTRSIGMEISNFELLNSEYIEFLIGELAIKPGRYIIGVDAVQSNSFLDKQPYALSINIEPGVFGNYVTDNHQGVYLPKADWVFG